MYSTQRTQLCENDFKQVDSSTPGQEIACTIDAPKRVTLRQEQIRQNLGIPQEAGTAAVWVGVLLLLASVEPCVMDPGLPVIGQGSPHSANFT